MATSTNSTNNFAPAPSEFILNNLKEIGSEVNKRDLKGIKEDLNLMEIFKKYIESNVNLKVNEDVNTEFLRTKNLIIERRNELSDIVRSGLQ